MLLLCDSSWNEGARQVKTNTKQKKRTSPAEGRTVQTPRGESTSVYSTTAAAVTTNFFMIAAADAAAAQKYWYMEAAELHRASDPSSRGHHPLTFLC